MYPDSGYKTTHAQSVCTRPFSRGEGPGDEASGSANLVGMASFFDCTISHMSQYSVQCRCNIDLSPGSLGRRKEPVNDCMCMCQSSLPGKHGKPVFFTQDIHVKTYL